MLSSMRFVPIMKETKPQEVTMFNLNQVLIVRAGDMSLGALIIPSNGW